MPIALKVGNMIDEKKLNKGEAIDFIVFLEYEIDRHIRACRKCQSVLVKREIPNILRQSYKCSYENHKKDIYETAKGIDYLRNTHVITETDVKERKLNLRMARNYVG